MNAQFERETEQQEPMFIPDNLLEEWGKLAEHGLMPNYDGEYGDWYLLDIRNHGTNIAQIKQQIINAVKSNNEKVENWNKKATLLSSLGSEHVFVQGYLSSEPGFWSMMAKGDGECCLYGKGCKPRSVNEYLEFIVPRLRSLWPNGFASNPLSHAIGYFANAYFWYTYCLPDLEEADINNHTLLSDFVIGNK